MQDGLSPAHGLHTVIKPDPMTWGYPSEVAGYILFKQQQSPFGDIVKFNEFEQKLGNTPIHNSLFFQHSCYQPEVENPPNLP